MIQEGIKPQWSNKSVYLENVSGQRIVEEQSRINSVNSFVVATQVFPIQGKLVARKQDNSLHQAYDCFIYYKERITLEENKSDEIIEDTGAMNIVIP